MEGREELTKTDERNLLYAIYTMTSQNMKA
jgi:hypothetical protein